MAAQKRKESRYGMVIDLDRCTGCGACMIACVVENNVPPAHRETTERTGITPVRVFQIDNGLAAGDRRTAFIPVLCQQCGEHVRTVPGISDEGTNRLTRPTASLQREKEGEGSRDRAASKECGHSQINGR